MRQVLLENDKYRYLLPGAWERLNHARQLANEVDFANKSIIPLGSDAFCVFPWSGTIAFNTLLRYLKFSTPSRLTISAVNPFSPFCIKLACIDGFDKLREELRAIPKQQITGEELLDINEAPEVNKFDRFIPDSLRRKAFIADQLDADSLKKMRFS